MYVQLWCHWLIGINYHWPSQLQCVIIGPAHYNVIDRPSHFTHLVIICITAFPIVGANYAIAPLLVHPQLFFPSKWSSSIMKKPQFPIQMFHSKGSSSVVEVSSLMDFVVQFVFLESLNFLKTFLQRFRQRDFPCGLVNYGVCEAQGSPGRQRLEF